MRETKHDDVLIQMMDTFQIKVNGFAVRSALMKSRKSVALLQYLILSSGQPVANQRLTYALWPEERNANPENALKTLISRMRTMLNQISDGLGQCIVASHGAYQWVNQPNVTVDVLNIEFLLDQLSKKKFTPDQTKQRYNELLRLYTGDFMQNEDVEQDDWVLGRIATLHTRFDAAMYEYLKLLRAEENYDEIIVVCRKALEISSFDDRLHMEMIDALEKTGRQNEAMNQYRSAEQQKYYYLKQPLNEELQEFYKKRIIASQSLDLAMDAMEREMTTGSSIDGAYVCEYMVFKDIYNLQVQNVERLGATMNLALIQVGDTSGRQLTMLDQDNLMSGLMDVIRSNLRKSDLVCRYNATTAAMLLTMHDPAMGQLVLDRIRSEFFRKFSSSNVSFISRVQRISNGDVKDYMISHHLRENE